MYTDVAWTHDEGDDARVLARRRTMQYDAQLGPIYPDLDGGYSRRVQHDPERSWTPIPCSGGCGRELHFRGTYAEVDWTCRECFTLGASAPRLRALEGGRNAGA